MKKLEGLDEFDEFEDLVVLSSHDFKCDNKMCIDYEKYNQCFTYAHVLCPLYDDYGSEN